MNLLKSNSWKKIPETMLMLSIVVLAGCQAILGVDFNQALKNSLFHLIKLVKQQRSLQINTMMSNMVLHTMNIMKSMQEKMKK